MFQGDAFTAWAELWMAARTDEDLRSVVVEMDRRFVEESRAVFRELVPPADAATEAALDTGFAFAFALMDGLALQGLVPTAHLPPPERSIDLLKAFAQLLDQQTPPPKDPT